MGPSRGHGGTGRLPPPDRDEPVPQAVPPRDARDPQDRHGRAPPRRVRDGRGPLDRCERDGRAHPASAGGARPHRAHRVPLGRGRSDAQRERGHGSCARVTGTSSDEATHGGRRASALLVALAGCSTTTPGDSEATSSVEPSVAPVASASPRAATEGFPTAVFAGLGDEPVSDELAAELQEVLDTSANGDGLTATLITPEGTWSGATGFAAGDRAMVPNDQMSHRQHHQDPGGGPSDAAGRGRRAGPRRSRRRSSSARPGVRHQRGDDRRPALDAQRDSPSTSPMKRAPGGPVGPTRCTSGR